MDKNTFTGLLLIGAIIIGFSILNKPSEEEIAQQNHLRDSLEQIQAKKERIAEQQIEAQPSSQLNEKDEASVTTEIVAVLNDSAQLAEKKNLYGSFSNAAIAEEEFIEVESDLMKLTFSTKGGRLVNAVLKEYETYDGRELVLFDSTSRFNLNFFASKENKDINTEELVFTTDESSLRINGEGSKVLSFRLDAGNDRHIEYIYTIKGNDYLIDFDINMVGMNDVIDMRSGEVSLNWMVNAPNQEKSIKPQRDVTTIFYKYKGEDVDYLTPTSDEEEDFEASLKWVSLKQQFFNTTLIADDYFSSDKTHAKIETDEGSTDYVKKLEVKLSILVTGSNTDRFGMGMYLGPNQYYTLQEHGHELEDIVDLGWDVFSWVNKYAVIPVFTFLDGFDLNYGLIILILTLLLKLVLSPITYKTYLSGAKMRVLKPEINEINEKHKDDAMKKQQAMMALYRQTGVNPLSGCIPMIIQMPILIAMFRFFPASIELRQESFLWADDLSTYDSIYDFPAGIDIPFYGDHISLFTLLMAASIMVYTKFNSQMTMGATAEGPMAAQMKIMTYMMPVMMLFFFNSYSSGLSYYYFLANVISIGQTFLIRKVFINEDSIRAKIEKNKKNPKAKKKSGFQKRMEEMAKQKGIQPPKK